uniref:Uncharacterized protein n=1 Tax=Lyngbya confervoides BDU141951 TaxID=1574623 RepID=A0A0C1YCX3_9CYAN
MEETITLLSGDGQPVEGRICAMQERHWRDFQTLWQTMLVATDQPDAAWMLSFSRIFRNNSRSSESLYLQ